MSIESALKSAPKSKGGGPQCETCRWLATLTPERETAARSLMAIKEWSHAALAAELAEDGLEVSGGTLGRHRAGECQGERARR